MLYSVVLRRIWKTAKSGYCSFVISVRPSVRLSAWNNSAPNGRILIKLNIWAFFRKYVEKIQVSLKSDKNNGYFIWRRFDIFDDISLNSF
jgi:hypothetical protein